MNISKRLKLSRFILSCIFLSGYAAYTVYAIYYYRNYEDSRIGGILLCLTGGFLDAYTYVTRGGVFANQPQLNPAELAPLFPDPFSLSISENSDTANRPLLESDALGSAVRAGNSLRDLSVRVNTSLSSLSPEEREAVESLQRSRASDVADWNEQQIQDLFGSHEGDL